MFSIVVQKRKSPAQIPGKFNTWIMAWAMVVAMRTAMTAY